MVGRATRSRTFTGCGTCRGRHLKCDEKRPICGNCKRLSLACHGYASKLLWLVDNGEEEQQHRARETLTYRHPLFSENERHLMATELTASTNGRSTTTLLAELDEQCDENSCSDGIEIGPFGAFRAAKTTHLQTSPGTEATDTSAESFFNSDDIIEEITREVNNHGIDFFGLEDAQDEPLTNQLQLADALTARGDLNLSLAQLNGGWSPLNLFGVDNLAGGDSSFRFDDLTNIDAILAATNPRNSILDPLPTILRTPSPSINGRQSSVMAEASFLLRYYKEKVQGCSPGRWTRKSVWQLLVMPSAMQTYAEMAVFNSAPDTRCATFYALLANSAFHLHWADPRQADAQHWLETGHNAQALAKTHLKGALQADLAQADYKELLMAMLAMAMVSSYYEPQHTMKFLVDAERLIRQRGLPNPRKSFKVRLLHHVYTHLRILAESISVPSASLDDQQLSIRQPNTLGTPHRFRIAEDSLDVNLDPSREKDIDVGYNDIHLEVLGKWESLYPDMYGTSEALMTLLSRSICLANDKKRLETLAISNPKIANALSRHTKKLERNIWALSVRDSPPRTQNPDNFYENMANAVHRAIVIYFYRRIHNVDAMMLQDAVSKTLDHLHPCLSVSESDQDFTWSIAWPAFISACEAATPELQEKALGCLAHIDNLGVSLTPQKGSDIAQQVWQRRKDMDDYTISWLDIIGT